MPMLEIPYAQSAPYDNSDYVARMADLMLRRGDVESDALRRAGDRRAQMWTNAGNVAMSTIAQIGAARDAERQRALALQQQAFENAMKQRDYDLREKERADARAERESDREWRRFQFRDQSARNMADDMAPGTVVLPDAYRRDIDGTSAAPRFEHHDAESARLPARPIADNLLVAGRAASVPNAPVFSAQVVRRDAEDPTDDVMMASMSPNIEARPERYVRVPNFTERKTAEELDMRRRANEIAAMNTLVDNQRDADTARATEEYRKARLQQGNRDRQPTSASLAWAAAHGDPEAQKALDILRRTEGGRSPQQIQNFMTITNQYQKSPLINAVDRTVVLADAMEAIKSKSSDRAAQLELGYAYVQALDMYQSAVREGELRNLGELGTKLEQLKLKFLQIASNGSFMPPDVAKDIANNSGRLINAINAAAARKTQDFQRRAHVAGIGDMWDAYMGSGVAPEPAAPGDDNWFSRNSKNAGKGKKD